MSSLRRRPPASVPRGRRAITAAVWLGLTGATVLLILSAFGDRLRPRATVRVAPVLLLASHPAAGGSAAAAPPRAIAQASGWIEPEPYPVRVPVKTDGFVEFVHVLEGEAVRRGQLVATLDATNHSLRVTSLDAGLAEARAAIRVGELEIRLAETDIQEAESNLEAAQARLVEARDRSRRLAGVDQGNVSEIERQAAIRQEAEARAEVAGAETRLTRARLNVARKEAQADQQRAAADRLAAERDQAVLERERTRVHAPIDGVVLRRLAAPGMKRIADMDDPDSATIVTLYDPSRLRVRVDVPLGDIGGIRPGAGARVVTAAYEDRAFTGRVNRVAGEADAARNTVEVHVAIDHPEPGLRPEMLCRVEFLSEPKEDPLRPEPARVLWIPTAAVRAAGPGRTVVWVVDPIRHTAERREVTVGAVDVDGLRPVFDGLRPGEKVVVDGAGGLQPGMRVKPTAEDIS